MANLRASFVTSAAALLVAAALPSPAPAVSPEQAASYCYDQAKKMGFASREMEDRSWEDCMAQFRRSATVPAPPAVVAPAPPPGPSPLSGLTPEQQALLIQQWMLRNQRPPAPNIGLEAGRGMLRALCNSDGGYYTPDGQCLRPTPPPLQLPARLPSWSCTQFGNMTNCSAF